MRIIAFLSPEKGSGKTTSAANLASVLASNGQSVLLIDMALNRTITYKFGLGQEKGIAELIANSANNIPFPPERELIVNVNGVDCIASTHRLSLVEQSIGFLLMDNQLINKTFKNIKEYYHYDFVFIDCDPGLHHWNEMVIAAADSLVITILPNESSLLKLQAFLLDIDMLQEKVSPSTDVEGIIVNKLEKDENVDYYIKEFIKREITIEDSDMYVIGVPKSAAVKNAFEKGLSLNSYKKHDIATDSYREFAEMARANIPW